MKRLAFLVLAALTLCAAGTPALATTKSKSTRVRDLAYPKIVNYDGRKVTPDATGSEIPVWSEDQIDTMFYYRGERVVYYRFHEGCSPGGSRDWPDNIFGQVVDRIRQMKPGQRSYALGTTDPERFKPDTTLTDSLPEVRFENNNKRSQISNHALGTARGNWATLMLKNRMILLPESVPYFKRGFFHIVTEPITPPAPPASPGPVTNVTRINLQGATLYPTFGAAYLALPGNQEEISCVTYGVVVDSVRFFGGTHCSIYVFDGFTMQSSEEKIRGAGLQFGKRGPFVRVGAVGASRNWLNDQHSKVIVRGGNLGLGYEWKVVTLGVNLGAYHWSNDSSGDWFGGIGAFVHIGPNF